MIDSDLTCKKKGKTIITERLFCVNNIFNYDKTTYCDPTESAYYVYYNAFIKSVLINFL